MSTIVNIPTDGTEPTGQWFTRSDLTAVPAANAFGGMTAESFYATTSKYFQDPGDLLYHPLDGTIRLNSLGYLCQVWQELIPNRAPYFNDSVFSSDSSGSLGASEGVA